MLEHLPILGICGYRNAGKTTLIEQIVPLLSEQGLQVAAVKCSCHIPAADATGKDTDRFFRSGADVCFLGGNEGFFRVHTVHDTNLPFVLKSLCEYNDIVLVEGRPKLPFAKVWLASHHHPAPPSDIDGIIDILSMNTDRVGALMGLINRWLPKQWVKTPVFGCILIGGKSSRMGLPKHLILENGTTWLDKTVEVLSRITEKVVIVGNGSVPDSLGNIPHLPDSTGLNGPVSGILSAMRWAPDSSFIVAACDLPYLSPEALQWLLTYRRPGIWAVLPGLPGNMKVEPLLSYYDVRARILLEKGTAAGIMKPSQIASHPSVAIVVPPDSLAVAWTNVNTKHDFIYRCP